MHNASTDRINDDRAGVSRDVAWIAVQMMGNSDGQCDLNLCGRRLDEASFEKRWSGYR